MESIDIALANREREEARYEAALPVCVDCGYPIGDDYYYETDEGDILCRDCLLDRFAKSTESYVQAHYYD